ncbi:DUF6876 family protein [Arenibacter latericius]|uniref:DUF6876 family protein n=1 Tax=Arenibacter latericius TaxID=86104 RepID=UPI00040E21BB|nr:DUF6876 family protein [Arenibacter latericius]
MRAHSNEILRGLQHFHGSEILYIIPLTGTRYTEGIKYLANVAECYWLITDASIMAISLMKQSSFITIDYKRLSKEKQDYIGYEAEVIYGDGNDNIFQSHRYRVTDFPLNELRLFYVNNTLMLPSEY